MMIEYRFVFKICFLKSYAQYAVCVNWVSRRHEMDTQVSETPVLEGNWTHIERVLADRAKANHDKSNAIFAYVQCVQ